MGGGQSSRAGNAVGILVLVGIGGALLYGGARFLLVVREGRSPGTLAWIAMGLLLFALGVTVGAGIAKMVRADEDRAGTVSALTGVLVAALGLGASYYWAEIREPALVKALGAACRGQAVDAAPAPGGVRRILVLDDRGHKIDWTTLHAPWRAEKVADADLVACLQRNEERVETCTYRSTTGGVATTSFDRVEEVLVVRVVETSTANPVGQFELRGTPRECKEVEKQGQGDLHGHVAFDVFSKALTPFRG